MQADTCEGRILHRALESAMIRNSGKWYRFVLGILKNEADAEEALQEALVGPADHEHWALGAAADLEDEGLDVLADPVVLERALLAGGEDRLDALADVEDDRARLHAADRARQGR